MLTILIYLTDVIRRALRKLRNGFTIVAESFVEAQEIRRKMRKHYVAD